MSEQVKNDLLQEALNHPVPRLPYSQESNFAVSLSGGGHRATLYGLGGLMAIVDSGANVRTRQIASVSGGSIANLVVAHACEFNKTDSKAFSAIAKKMFKTVSKGVLTKPIFWALVGVLAIPIIIFMIAAISGHLPGPRITLPAISLWLLLILLRGLPIEFLFRVRYFWRKQRPLRLGSLSAVPDEKDTPWSRDQQTEHVVCCTDLVSGKPVYFSTFNGGIAFSRFNVSTWQGCEISDAGKVSVAAILRASAGFPGIPPRRFQLIGRSWASWPSWRQLRQGTIAFLADGGIWNNLGTQSIVEDHFYHGEYGQPPSMPVICLDASADLGKSAILNFHIPGWAEIQALFREFMISNNNTVTPRRDNFAKSLADEIHSSSQPFGPRPMVLSLPYSPANIAFFINRWLYLRWLEFKMDTTELEANNDYWFQLWNGDLLGVEDDSRMRDALSAITGRRSLWYRVIELLNSPAYKELCEIASIEPPRHLITPDYLFVNHSKPSHESQHLHDIINSYGIMAEGVMIKQAKSCENSSFIGTPTTLDAVGRNIGRQLVGRGYANTVIALYMLGLIDSLPSLREHHPWLFRETV